MNKVATHCKEQNKRRIMTIGRKTKNLFKDKKCQKNSKLLVLKYIKVLEFLKTPKTILNKGTKLINNQSWVKWFSKCI